MYDALTSHYTFACPNRGEARVRLSAFRRLHRLPGASHPAVYHVDFECSCGEEHPTLVSHDQLDWAPLGLAPRRFVNLMTSRVDDLGSELGDLAARRIGAGEWPWTFFCFPEDRPRPVSPSSFFLLAPASRALGLAVLCPTCGHVSVNLVSRAHVDVPWHHDREVGVIEHVFRGDAETIVEEFTGELHSARFDARRLELE